MPLRSIEGNNRKENAYASANLIDKLVVEYRCREEDMPRWRVVRDDALQPYLIRPGNDDEFIAKKIAALVTQLGGTARVERIEG